MSVLEELEETIQSAAERFGPAVIGLGSGWGRGSGFVIDSGRILTNAHNLRGDEVTVTFHDGRHESGRVLASDADVDLAVIEADTAGIEPLQWSEEDLESLPIGRAVLALANPGGRGLRVTPGFVSSTARRFRGPRRHRIRIRDRAHRAAAPRIVGRAADRPGRAAARGQLDPHRRRPHPGRARRSGHPRARGEAESRGVAPTGAAGRGDRAAPGGPSPSPRGRPARARRHPDPGGRARQRRPTGQGWSAAI